MHGSAGGPRRPTDGRYNKNIYTAGVDYIYIYIYMHVI
jgi:hypothetical protein